MSRLRGGTRRRPRAKLGAFVWGIALSCSASCAKPLGEQECDKLLEHYTERLLREEQPDVSNVEVGLKQAEAKRLAHEAPRFEFERCPELVSRQQFECAMTAGNVDGVERCLM